MHEEVLNLEAFPPKSSEAFSPRKSTCLHSAAAFVYYSHVTPLERSMLFEASHDRLVVRQLLCEDDGVIEFEI